MVYSVLITLSKVNHAGTLHAIIIHTADVVVTLEHAEERGRGGFMIQLPPICRSMQLFTTIEKHMFMKLC